MKKVLYSDVMIKENEKQEVLAFMRKKMVVAGVCAAALAAVAMGFS